MQARPGIAASQEAHSAADSFDIGSTHRFATSANNTRSTSVVNRREPSALFSASSTPSIRHSPSSRCTVPIGRDSATRRWSPTSWAASAGSPAGPGSPRYRLIEATSRVRPSRSRVSSRPRFSSTSAWVTPSTFRLCATCT